MLNRNGFLTAALLFLLFQIAPCVAIAQTDSLGIDHRYHNTDAQSLIGLPMGSHKTIVERDGSLKWSQWSLKRRELDSPIGFSAQMDGMLAIEPFVESTAAPVPLKIESQTLYSGRYPFVVSKSAATSSVRVEELAFAVDPDADPANFPEKNSGAKGLDVVRITFINNGSAPAKALLKLSGRQRNLPGHVVNDALIAGSGEDVAIVSDHGGATLSREDNGLTLTLRVTLASKESKTIWVRLPYEWPSARNAELSTASGDELLKKAVAQWDGIWSRGAQMHYPQQVLNDFYRASIAYVLILTEYDASGDLWVLDGPAVYRQYWGRGEYFQARAMEVAGYLEPARESVEHAWHIINDDGEWDGPPVSGWPAWDNIGGNAGAAWDYFLYTRDQSWLAKAYPYLLRGEVAKNAAMLIAAINHSYTTNVFKEEILTNVTKERACEGPHSNRQNGQGTGDMPEAWGNANGVDLLRDMLVQERTDAPTVVGSKTTLHLLSGLPAEWLAKAGEVASVERTPTTLGTVVSVKAMRTAANKLRVEFDPGSRPVQAFVHVPLARDASVVSATMDGKPLPATAITTTKTGEQADVAGGEIARPVVFEFTLSETR